MNSKAIILLITNSSSFNLNYSISDAPKPVRTEKGKVIIPQPRKTPKRGCRRADQAQQPSGNNSSANDANYNPPVVSPVSDDEELDFEAEKESGIRAIKDQVDTSSVNLVT